MSDFFAPSYWYGAGPNIAPLPINTNYGQQLNQQLAYVGAQNQAALAAAAPMPPGYGQVHLPYLSGSFGPPAAAGTYSPGSGLSSFSGSSLGGSRQPAADPWAGTGFDPIQYLHNNPDVAGATGGDPMKAYEHARSYGYNEGRGGTDMFKDYGESWSPPQERINQGWDAFSRSSPQSSYDFGSANRGITNPMNRVDWGQSFGTRGGDLASIYRQWGAEQPGRYDADLDRLSGEAWSYLNDPNNADLRVAFGHDVFKAAQHAQDFGKNEGRNLHGLPGGIGSDAARSASEQYFQANPDVAAWAGGDPAKAWQHYSTHGQGEGRESFGLQGRDAVAGALSAQKSPYAGSILGPAANPSYFNPGTYAGDRSNYGLPFNPAGVPRAPAAMPSSQRLLGYDPSTSAQFAPGAANTFQGRFGMGFPNAGTPSQYAPGAQMPPGFSGTYGADNPSGALPLNWLQSIGTGGA